VKLIRLAIAALLGIATVAHAGGLGPVPVPTQVPASGPTNGIHTGRGTLLDRIDLQPYLRACARVADIQTQNVETEFDIEGVHSTYYFGWRCWNSQLYVTDGQLAMETLGAPGGDGWIRIAITPEGQPVVSCRPCGAPRFIGGDVGDPNSWVMTWSSDGKEHSLRERPIGITEEKAQAWARLGMSNPQMQRTIANVMNAWGIPLPECPGLVCR
jgi:hypothetical protein